MKRKFKRSYREEYLIMLRFALTFTGLALLVMFFNILIASICAFGALIFWSFVIKTNKYN